MTIRWCATGHRPDKLGGYDSYSHARVQDFAAWYLRQHRPEVFVSGMAQGWDQACAQACIDLGIPWEAAVPFPGQESKWPQAAQEKYRALLARADRVVEVSPRYSPAAMQERNEYMVRASDGVIALWDGSSGGTGNCIRFAKHRDIPIVNLWPWWEQFA
jgi:uncharacterized phage-like protein YoqJ